MAVNGTIEDELYVMIESGPLGYDSQGPCSSFVAQAADDPTSGQTLVRIYDDSACVVREVGEVRALLHEVAEMSAERAWCHAWSVLCAQPDAMTSDEFFSLYED